MRAATSSHRRAGERRRAARRACSRCLALVEVPGSLQTRSRRCAGRSATTAASLTRRMDRPGHAETPAGDRERFSPPHPSFPQRCLAAEANLLPPQAECNQRETALAGAPTGQQHPPASSRSRSRSGKVCASRPADPLRCKSPSMVAPSYRLPFFFFVDEPAPADESASAWPVSLMCWKSFVRELNDSPQTLQRCRRMALVS